MNGFLKTKIRARLIISFAIILLIPSLTIGLTSYQSSKNTLEEHITLSASETGKLLDGTLDRFIDPEIRNIDYLADNISVSDTDLAESTLHSFFEKHPGISTIYVGGTDGTFVNAPAKKMADDYDPRKRPWYQQAMNQKGEVTVTPPFESKTTGDFVVGIAKVLKDGSGVLASEVKLETIEAITKQVKIGKEGYALILDKDRKAIIHPALKPNEEAVGIWVDKIFETDKGQFDYSYENEANKMVFFTNENTGWKVAGTLSKSEVQDEAMPIFLNTAFVLAIALFIGAVLSYFIISSITKPLRTLVYASEKIGNGDLTETVMIKSHDELGQLGASFNTMAGNLRDLIAKIGMNTDQLAASAEELSANAEETGKATEQIAYTIQEVAEGTDKQMDSVQKSSIQIGELAIEVSRIAENAQHVTTSSAHTSEKATEGEISINQAIDQMNKINVTFGSLSESVKTLGDRSNEINKIIEVISSIAAQINLLALNAAIEAARAGDHGKGFAVVAEEVRKLAEQSSESSQQISALIAGIQEETNKTISSMDNASNEVKQGIGVVNIAGDSFNLIKESVNLVTNQIHQISTSVEKISSITEEVVFSVNDISAVAETAASGTQNVSAATEEQLASMEEISASANALSNIADELQHAIASFRV
ncbi:HAMP domain-containing protein [Peribacillus saganii]|uniref:HAMP domain-containing protein n=1 Tax=Peribacillus saganii TaxID=2303992 RepID=A0A372LN10_9BACI|nr:methyl-accepting chemotaxis protein [Peribacillus saganii]RFU68739.1 HAMP domain-containing protein [Peribacillus saganii]